MQFASGNVCDSSFSLACVRSLASMACLLQMLNSNLQDTADFEKKDVKCSGTKVPRISLYSAVKNKQSVAFTDGEILNLSDVKICDGPARLPLHAYVYSDLCL